MRTINKDDLAIYVSKELDILVAESNIVSSFCKMDDDKEFQKLSLSEKTDLLITLSERFGIIKGKILMLKEIVKKFEI